MHRKIEPYELRIEESFLYERRINRACPDNESDKNNAQTSLERLLECGIYRICVDLILFKY